MKRVQIVLTAEEKKEFRRLKTLQGEAFNFWFKVAVARDLDFATIIDDGTSVHALPLNHGKHWCWPISLKCKKKPIKIHIHGYDDEIGRFD